MQLVQKGQRPLVQQHPPHLGPTRPAEHGRRRLQLPCGPGAVVQLAVGPEQGQRRHRPRPRLFPTFYLLKGPDGCRPGLAGDVLLEVAAVAAAAVEAGLGPV